MKLSIFTMSLSALLFISAPTPAQAADASLNLQSDLMIAPAQLGNFFNITANTIKNSPSWSWPAINLTAPYKTSWSQVEAQGPFNVSFNTSALNTQEFAFTFTWANPQLNIGQFAINDSVTTTQDGVNLIINLNGTCTGMTLSVPQGNWTVNGKMRWDFQTQNFVVSWESFQLQMNQNAVPQVNVGQCQGANILIQDVHDALASVAQNQALLQSAMQAGLLNWVQGTLQGLQSQLLAARPIQIQSGLQATWQPSQLSAPGGGLLRVAGNFTLTKVGAKAGALTVARTITAGNLAAVTSSGFILPKTAVGNVLTYLYANGGLNTRINSTTISAFQSFLQNGFEELLVWPDLLNFASTTAFYFDLSSGAAPSLTNGYMMDGGGSAYNITTPLVVHQWAPYGGSYGPYVDFTSPLSGTMSAKLSSGNLTLQMTTPSLSLSSAYRSEYTKSHVVDTYIADSILASQVQTYLNSQTYSFAVPNFSLASTLSLQMTDLQAYTQSFRIPLNFVSTP